MYTMLKKMKVMVSLFFQKDGQKDLLQTELRLRGYYR